MLGPTRILTSGLLSTLILIYPLFCQLNKTVLKVLRVGTSGECGRPHPQDLLSSQLVLAARLEVGQQEQLELLLAGDEHLVGAGCHRQGARQHLASLSL